MRTLPSWLRSRWPRRGWIPALGALLGLVALGSPQHYRDDLHSANEASRIYAALALVDHSTLRLDPVFDRFFPGWRARPRPPNMDVSRRNGHYYTDKAPGVTLMAVPVLVTLRALGIHLRYAQLAWLLSLLLAAVPSLIFGWLLLGRLRRNLGETSAATLVAPALVLATPWLIYSAQLFGHALAASLVGAGILLALGPFSEAPPRQGRLEPLLGGLCLGLATLTEYPAGILALLVCVAVGVDRERRARLLWICLGGAGPAFALAAWNTLAFGGPLSFSYGFKADPALAATHAHGLFGIGWPDLGAIYGLLLSPERGLLFLSPWLLAGLVGVLWAPRLRGLAVAWKILLPAGSILPLLLIAGFPDWHGGRCLGPRYILLALPPLGIGAALLLHRVAAWRHGGSLLAAAAGLALSSLLLALAGHLGFPHVSHLIHNPMMEVVVPVWLEGGPGPTIWRPIPGGAILAVVACLGLGALCCAPLFARRSLGENLRTESSHTSPAPAQRPPGPSRIFKAALLVAAALLHLALVTIPTTAGRRGHRRVLRERAFAHEMLGQPEAARRLRESLDRLGRSR